MHGLLLSNGLPAALATLRFRSVDNFSGAVLSLSPFVKQRLENLVVEDCPRFSLGNLSSFLTDNATLKSIEHVPPRRRLLTSCQLEEVLAAGRSAASCRSSSCPPPTIGICYDPETTAAACQVAGMPRIVNLLEPCSIGRRFCTAAWT